MHEVNVEMISQNSSSDEIAFLGSLSSDSSDPWMTEVKIDNFNTVFKIDTGADVTAVPTNVYEKRQFSELQQTRKVLMGPGRSP